jgi:hypothetical protein
MAQNNWEVMNRRIELQNKCSKVTDCGSVKEGHQFLALRRRRVMRAEKGEGGCKRKRVLRGLGMGNRQPFILPLTKTWLAARDFSQSTDFESDGKTPPNSAAYTIENGGTRVVVRTHICKLRRPKTDVVRHRISKLVKRNTSSR